MAGWTGAVAVAAGAAGGAGAAVRSGARGTVADGLIRGAQIYIDTNRNGMADAPELLPGVVTDANGQFVLPADVPAGDIIAVGGVNVDTGIPNTMALKAPAGSTVVNPLTTLVHATIARERTLSGTTLDVEAAEAAVVRSLGITLPAGTSLTRYDPITAGDVAVQKLAASVASLVTLGAGSDATAADGMLGRLAGLVSHSAAADAALNLTDHSVVGSVLGAGTTATSSVLAALQTIARADTLAAVTTAQAGAMDTRAPASPVVTALATTSPVTDASPVTFRVTFDVTATDGSAAVVGDRLQLVDEFGALGPVVILGARDIEAAAVELALPAFAPGSHAIHAVLSDQAGFSTQSAAAYAFTVADAPDAVVVPRTAQSPFLTSVVGSGTVGTPGSGTSPTGGAGEPLRASLDYGDALVAALFSNVAYQTPASVPGLLQAYGWQSLDGAYAQGLEVGNAYAFAAKRTGSDGRLQLALAFEGSNAPTDQFADWVDNLAQYGWSRYYASLMPLMTAFVQEAMTARGAGQAVELFLTGHSLGGAAAQMAYADLFVPSGRNLWPDAAAPLGNGQRLYDQTGLDAWSDADIRGLLDATSVYTFGAPSILIEPTKPPGNWYTSVSGVASFFYDLATVKSSVLTVNPARVPELSAYADHAYQFEHLNTGLFKWNDPVGQLGSEDPGRVFAINLDNGVYARYGGSLVNPIATHSIEYYGESIARLLTGDTLTKSPDSLASLSPRLAPVDAATAGNDLLVNKSLAGGEGNDVFLMNAAGRYSASGGRGDDAFVLSAYGIELDLTGMSGDGVDSVYFELAGTVSARLDAGTRTYVLTDAVGQSATVRVPDGAYRLDHVAQINTNANTAWTLTYHDQAVL